MDLNPVHVCVPRAALTEADHLLDRVRRPFEHRLNRSVSSVAHPAGHAAGFGALAD